MVRIPNPNAKCEICGMDCISINALKKHIRKEHSEIDINKYLKEFLVPKMNNSLPNLNSASRHFFQKIITKDFRILEFGSGFSTPWLARRAQYILSYEHDKDWYIIVKDLLEKYKIKNCQLIYDPNYYHKSIDYKDEFDMIIIDGRRRVNCFKMSIEYLKGGGYLFLDDSQRKIYRRIKGICKDWPNHHLKQKHVIRESDVWTKPEGKKVKLWI